MNELSAILNNLNKFTTEELETLVQKFPYFQQGHLLLAKKYQQEGNAKFDQQLQLAALYTRDRELLYTLFKETVTPFLESEPSIQTEETPTSEIILPEFPSVDEEPVLEKEPEVVEEDIVLTPVTPAEEFQPEQPEVLPVIEEPVLENEPELEKREASTSINDLIIDLEDKQEVKEEEQPPVKQREKIDEYTMSPLVFGEEQKILPVDEAPIVEEETEFPPVKEEQIITPLMEEQREEEQGASSPASPHTFDEWLKMYAQSNAAQMEPEVKPEPIKEVKQKDELNELIAGNPSDYLHQLVKEETTYSPGLTKFIEAQIQKHKHAELKKPASDNHLDPDLITETMARIYEMQRKYDKAINAYEVLRLKFPEKNDTFAARIEHLKSIL